ncbi:conserved exported hypothetical protein [Gammaproteobacteria bacterium]
MFFLLSRLVIYCLFIHPGFSFAVGTLNALNDTGITQCVDDSGNFGACTEMITGDSAVNPRQDGRYGRDAAAAAGKLVKIGGGRVGFDFTKIANDGSELHASAALGAGPKDWACIRDNVTGILWEVKTNDGGIRDKDNTYIFSNAVTFVAAVNATGLCGFNDWRLPTIRELTGIVHHSVASGSGVPTIDTTYFPNTPVASFWSDSTFASNAGYAWYVNFSDGSTSYYPKYAAFQVRLARAGQYSVNLTDNLDGTVTDSDTGLMWASCGVGQTYNKNDGTCIGSASSLNWDGALSAARDSRLGGYSDWRVPNISELRSIIDYSRVNAPTIDTLYFPNTPVTSFWSSSPVAGSSDKAWVINFNYGDNSFNPRINNSSAVRLVRAGQSFDLLAPPGNKLTVNRTGTGSGVVTSTPAGIDCGSDCTEDYAGGTSVTLTATPATGSTFAGWNGGGCSGSGVCILTMNAATTVTATFNPAMYSLNVVKSGNGTVSSTPAGINCGTDCSENYAPGTSVTLKATPGAGSIFTKWSGACTGTSTSCVVAMNADKTTTANFLARPAATVITGAVAGNAQVTLTWTAMAGAASYKVFQGTTAGGESTTPVKTGVTGTSVVITGLTNGKKYFFKMAAVNAAGTSALSNEVGVTPRVSSRQADFVVTSIVPIPASPPVNGSFGVDVTIKNQGTVIGEGGYLDLWLNQSTVQACGAEGDAWRDIGILAAGASKTVTISLKADTTGGTKTLRAFVDSWCETVESNEINNQFARTYVVTPAAPTINVVKGNGQVTLKWTAVLGATSYNVFQGATAGAESTTPVKNGLTGTSVVITGLTNGTTYFFRMAAVNAGGAGLWSNEVSATPAP